MKADNSTPTAVLAIKNQIVNHGFLAYNEIILKGIDSSTSAGEIQKQEEYGLLEVTEQGRFLRVKSSELSFMPRLNAVQNLNMLG